MRRLLLIFPLALVCLGILLLAQRPAYGYTDPGTGLLAIQALGSAMVAAGWYLRRKLYGLLGRFKGSKPESEAERGHGAAQP